ncbi:MAG: hypothetical protein ACRERD_18335, partial [Candidatus Binatia bacterium]
MAIKYVDKALFDCGDDPPSLVLLQALILLSHHLLIKGVKGRAWRYLGTCVRVAYELNLHLIDAKHLPPSCQDDVTEWASMEEK